MACCHANRVNNKMICNLNPNSVYPELTQLSGVAAILRFPIADLSEAEEDSSSDED